MKRSRGLFVLTLLVLALAFAPSSSADFGYTDTPTASDVTLGGDVTGPANANSAVKINGSSVVAGGALTTGNVLQVNGVSSTTFAPLNLGGGANYVTGSLPSANQVAQSLGGDATGTTAAVVNAKVNGTTYPAGGALTTGNVAQVSGVGAVTYAAVNLAGGSAYVTGSLPSGNQAAQTCGGDVTGATSATTVGKIQGNTVTSGALTEGDFLVATSTSNWAQTAISGDISCSASTVGQCLVESIGGASPLVITPSTVEWGATVTTPTLTQASESTATKGADATWTPQQSTHATDQGGGNAIVSLETPTGAGVEAYLETKRGSTVTAALGAYPGNAQGALFLTATTPSTTNWAVYGDGSTTYINAPTTAIHYYIGNSTYLAAWAATDIGFGEPVGGIAATNAFSWSSVSVGVTSGSNINLTATQYANPHIKFTGTLTGAGTSVTFPATDGACWDLDFSAIVTITDSIALKANSQTWGTAVAGTSTEFPHVCYSAGVGRLVGVAMTQ